MDVSEHDPLFGSRQDAWGANLQGIPLGIVEWHFESGKGNYCFKIVK